MMQSVRFSDGMRNNMSTWFRQNMQEEGKPVIYSDFIWIIQTFFMKFSEIQVNLLKLQSFFGFESGRDFYIKFLFW